LGKHTYTAPVIFVVFALTLAPWLYNFPLNDDWAYAIGVQRLLSQGRLSLCDWGASTQLPHLLLGALCARLLGFSFIALKTYTLAAAAGTVFVFVKLLEELEIKPFDITLAALALALNPLFLILANSFMTDMTYLFWMSLSVYFYTRHLKTDGPGQLTLAGLCAAAAYLTRQIGLAVPLAYTFMLAAGRRLTVPDLLRTWGFTAAAAAGYALWFKYSNGATWASENYVFSATLGHLSHPMTFLSDAAFRAPASMMQLGMLLFPPAAGYFHAALRRQSGNSLRKLQAKSARPAVPARLPGNRGIRCSMTGHKDLVTAKRVGLALAVLLGVFILLNGPLPYLENTFSRGGIGVLTLNGAGSKVSGFFSSTLFWYAMTALAALSAAVLAGTSSLTLQAGGPAARFIFLSAAAHLFISLLGAKFFDRYLLTLLPWFILSAVFAARNLRFSRPAAATALALMAAVSWAGVKDYMQWNQAKWDLASRPRPDLAADEIVNGFDYEAWLNYEKNMAYLKSIKPLRLIGEWEWQAIQSHKARISFAPLPGLRTIDKTEYETPFSARKGILYLVKLQ
jgi:hypothetical protein